MLSNKKAFVLIAALAATPFAVSLAGRGIQRVRAENRAAKLAAALEQEEALRARLRIVSMAEIPVRAAPYPDAPAIGLLSRGDTVLADSAARTLAPENAYLVIDATVLRAEQGEVTVPAGSIVRRIGETSDGAVVAFLLDGQEFVGVTPRSVIERAGVAWDWTLVDTGRGYRGWVPARVLEFPVRIQ